MGPSCGRIDNFATGKEEVVVAGGNYHGDLQSVEIYSVHNDLWRQGNPLPNKVGYASYLPFEDSFIIIGGRDSSSLDTIYKVSSQMKICQGRNHTQTCLFKLQYRRDTNTWTKLKQRLATPDRGFVAMWVKRDSFPLC